MMMGRCSCFVFLLLAVAGGCSKGVSLKTVPVSGKVTLDGQPVSGATVTFLPEVPAAGAALAPSSGLTGADGSYKLITMGSGREAFDGIPPGNYKIIVTKQSSAAATPDMTTMMTNDPAKISAMTNEERDRMRGGGSMPNGQQPAAPKSEIPNQYATPSTSGFAATVAASGAQTFDFPLTSK